MLHSDHTLRPLLDPVRAIKQMGSWGRGLVLEKSAQVQEGRPRVKKIITARTDVRNENDFAAFVFLTSHYFFACNFCLKMA